MNYHARILVVFDTLKVGRGRPRGFDPEDALALGQRMFHAYGYDGVGLAALTQALGIKPPSFYTAFGSKADYFSRILDRYAQSVLALDDILVPGRSPEAALAELLERAAETYSRDPDCLGCLVLEAARGHADTESAALARAVAQGRRSMIKTFVAGSRPDVAQEVTDFVSSVMSGLSASAREGMSQARLLNIAHAASFGLTGLLKGNERIGAD